MAELMNVFPALPQGVLFRLGLAVKIGVVQFGLRVRFGEVKVGVQDLGGKVFDRFGGASALELS